MIQLERLSKYYKNNTIIDNITYQFPEKGLVFIIGDSGSGKSTLIRLIAGLDNHYKGDLIVAHKNLHNLSEDERCYYRNEYISFIFQDFQLFHNDSALENILYPCMLNTNDNDTNLKKANQLLTSLNIQEKANTKVKYLSGGEKQRVAIARALLNESKIILADEPTASLDYDTTLTVMKMLKEEAKTKLVIVITHENDLYDFADEILELKNKKLSIIKQQTMHNLQTIQPMTFLANKQSCSFKLAYKNFKTNFLKQCYLSVIFSISILFLLFSLSSGNIIDTAIDHFKQENITLTNGFIKRTDNIDIYQLLTNDARVDNVYKQFKLHDVILSKNNKEKLIKEKYPTPKAKQTLSYGSMPDNKKNEIALTPSLAKLFHPTIYELIGQEITLTYHSKSYSLIISGIYNAGYHDFVVSSNIEKELYSELEDNNFYSIHYDVKEFNDIVTVNEELLDKGIKSENAADQVQTLRVKFSKIQALFIISSVMISSISMFCTIVLTIKIHNIRYKMIELLYAVGFLRKTIYHSIIYESIFLSTLVVLQSIVLFSIVQVISNFFDFQLTLSIFQILFTMLCSSVLLFIINILIGKKIINKPLYKNIKL